MKIVDSLVFDVDSKVYRVLCPFCGTEINAEPKDKKIAITIKGDCPHITALNFKDMTATFEDTYEDGGVTPITTVGEYKEMLKDKSSMELHSLLNGFREGLYPDMDNKIKAIKLILLERGE